MDKHRYEIIIRDKTTGVEQKLNPEHIEVEAESREIKRYDISTYSDRTREISRGVLKYWNGIENFEDYNQ